MLDTHRLFRPPAEAYNLIVRVADGCPHNCCTFCGMYRGVKYRPHPLPEIRNELELARESWPDADRVFLADGDVMALPFDTLHAVLRQLNQRFPRLVRVNVYANGSSVLARTREQLCELRALKLHTLYMGLESGDETVLRQVRKPEDAACMVEAARLAQECGLRMSVMILIGLGGRARSDEHANATAAVLNRMQPRLLSALRVIPVPTTPLQRAVEAGDFEPLTEFEAVRELRDLIARLELERTVFRANHASNVVPLEGRFPKDKDRMRQDLNSLLESNTLDRNTPGPTPVWL